MPDFSGLIDVLGSGAILLGPEVTSDGFQRDRRIRIQSHIHSDHMKDFATSLGKPIVLSPPSFDLLRTQYQNLHKRPAVHQLEDAQPLELEGHRIRLISSNHMLGACQVEVELPDGIRVGYSGDFGWPLNNFIEVDALVVDATYGNPESEVSYTQREADEAFIDLVTELLHQGQSIHIYGHLGVAERSLALLVQADLTTDLPILAEERLRGSAEIYQEWGFVMPALLDQADLSAKQVRATGGYIEYHRHSVNDRHIGGARVNLTRYRTPGEPVTWYSNISCNVGLTNHASHKETLEYIRATGAKYVVTDGVRGKGTRAQNLAREIRNNIEGVAATVSSGETSMEWGG